jgi:hypothetical protein
LLVLLPRWLFSSALAFDLLDLDEVVAVLFNRHTFAHLAFLVLLRRHEDMSAGHLGALFCRSGNVRNLTLAVLTRRRSLAELDVVDHCDDPFALRQLPASPRYVAADGFDGLSCNVHDVHIPAADFASMRRQCHLLASR